MIRRALLIATAAVALSAAAAMGFTPALARAGRVWTRGIRTAFGITPVPRSVGGAHATNGALLQQDDEVQGAFCPIRPPADEPAALLPDSAGTQMSTDPRARTPIDTSTVAPGESLLPAAPALCRPSSATPPMQSTDRR
jgi:hypothetical protein